jgi:putative transport protein
MLDLLLGNPLLALFLVVTLGLLLGRINVAGLSLGSSGVIFTALALGHLGYRVPDGVGTLGLVLFVYCVGISAGPSFFRVFVRRGKKLALLGLALVIIGGLTSLGLTRLLGLPADLATGVFAGAMTSTPALAAAMEALPGSSEVAVGYGLAYPFGVVGVVLFVQLLPRLLRVDLGKLARAAEDSDSGEKVVRALVEVKNPSVVGRELDELTFIADAGCLVSRALVGRELEPVSPDHRLEEGELLLLVGRESDLPLVIEALGRRSERTDLFLETERHRMQIVATSREVVNHTLAELRLRRRFGVTISRVSRHGLEFVPRADHEIEHGEMLVAVGEPEQLARFAEHAGHRARAFDETDLISLGVGISIGVVAGMISFGLGGSSFSLGLAGGPLLVALVLGHLGQVGPIAGHLPRASRLVLQEVGLVFFLASAGVNAGGRLVEVLMQHSATLLTTAAAVALCPMVLGFLLAHFVLKLDLLQVLGAVCGGMTSTPGLGVITAKVDSEVPVVSYAAVYPVALILITVAARALVLVLAG